MAETNGHSLSNEKICPMWIDGKEYTTSSTFDVISPLDSKKLESCYGASVEDANKAVDSAQRAFKTWRKVKPQERRRIFLKAADIMESRAEEFARYMDEETGAPAALSSGFNIPNTIEMLRDTAGRTTTSLGAIPDTTEEGTGAFIFKEPYGVVFSIAPWNAPYILGMRAIIYPLATGNTAILKGSELSPRCFWAIGDCLHKAGLPAGALNIIYHRPEDAVSVTNAVIERNEVKKVTFTGSTAVGAIISAKCGKELKPCVMELGGKASAIVCKDAELGNAAFQCALGAMVHSGQICMSTERVLVHKDVLEAFTTKVKEAVEQIYPSSGQGPIVVTKVSAEKQRKLMQDAKSKGAHLVMGDPWHIDENKYRIRPYIITDVNKEMDIYYTESFGPHLTLIPFETEQEAIDIANDTEYGLSGSIFTENLGTGLRMAKEIDSGAIHINQMSVHDEAVLPHGGVKKSGWGRFNAYAGMEEFLKSKTVTYKGFHE